MPSTMHPCNHGCCMDCLETYISDHEGTTCMVCRTPISGVAPNFDLRDLCKTPEPDWKEKILRELPGGTSVEISEDMEPVAELVMYRLRHPTAYEDSRVLRNMKNCVTRLVQSLSFERLLKWILALNFEPDTERYLLEHLSKQQDNLEFLQEMKSEWLLNLLDL